MMRRRRRNELHQTDAILSTVGFAPPLLVTVGARRQAERLGKEESGAGAGAGATGSSPTTKSHQPRPGPTTLDSVDQMAMTKEK